MVVSTADGGFRSREAKKIIVLSFRLPERRLYRNANHHYFIGREESTPAYRVQSHRRKIAVRNYIMLGLASSEYRVSGGV